MHSQVVSLLADSSSSEHAAVAQRALQLWRSEAFVCLMRRQAGAIIPALVPALVRDGRVHWNDGVNNLISVVVDILGGLNESSRQLLHDEAAQYLFKTGMCSSTGSAAVTFNQYVQAVDERRSLRQQEEQERVRLKQERHDQHRRSLLPTSVKGHLNFIWGRDLGYGSYSVVRYAKFIEREVPQSLWLEFAIKVMNKEHVHKQNYEQQAAQEIAVLQALDHPAISRVFSTFEDAKNIYVVLEYCSQGDIFSIIFESNSAVNLEWFRFCLAEVACALEYLHTQGYYYGDLKPENILLTESGHIRLCDFGSCKNRDQLIAINEQLAAADDVMQIILQHVSGTADYLAPEVVTGRKLSVEADWWALGCLAFQLLAGYLPFYADTRDELFKKIANMEFTFPAAIVTQPHAKAVIEGLLQPDEQTRLRGQQLGDLPFFTGIDLEHPFDNPNPPIINLKRCGGEEVDSKWKRRKFSMMWNPIPSATSSESLQATLLDAIPEVDPDLMHWEAYGVSA